MKNSGRDRFDERLKNANQAKRNKLERFQAAADDPDRRVKRAQRDAAALARKSEQQAKATQLLLEKEERERLEAENAKRDEEQVAAREVALEAERAVTAEQAIAQKATNDAERKAERDRRYAARRNRKR
ncbi:DUF6481 family protein [Sedimentitalea todarodis]|uniref:DUF6481 family protein n=1 Tax=Sedimentitalea todarodis TaxID=1631240 RepID=A0ABU3VLI6_9RHOB|nr:DUF6481 family protein [Sedimentitalea todarodis]MDU9006999.1 DUF6481 family protein [Sedimentitalea todarodis]